MAMLKWVFMIFTFAYGFLNKGGGRSLDLLPILEAVGNSVDRAFRRALASFLLAGLAASLMVSGIVMTIVTGVFLANGTATPELGSLIYAGLGIMAAAVVLGFIAVFVARGRSSSLSTQMRAGYETYQAESAPPPRTGSPLEEAVAALIMDFVQARAETRARPQEDSQPRAQRQNSDPRDSEFANREFMN